MQCIAGVGEWSCHMRSPASGLEDSWKRCYHGLGFAARIQRHVSARKEGGRVVNRSGENSIASEPAGGSLAKLLSTLYPRLPCRFCRGFEEVVCVICDGKGKLIKGGYHKKNPISVERIIGSKWTAMESTFGWRHFQVQSKRRVSRKYWFVEMSATCDETARFWLNFQNLKERERWSMGWLQKSEIFDTKKEPRSNLLCKACKGKGKQPCSCKLRGPDETVLDIVEI